jgi:4a-hydroxytetrahydrobiopterin dehydratase
VAALSKEDISRALEDLPGWQFEGGEIFKRYRFPTFLDAIAFIDRIAEVAEESNHHPDLENHYDQVRVGLHTWSEDAVTGGTSAWPTRSKPSKTSGSSDPRAGSAGRGARRRRSSP